MNETFNNVISYSPAPEALEEVHVLTANSPADYGNVNGGDVISVLEKRHEPLSWVGLRVCAGLSAECQ